MRLESVSEATAPITSDSGELVGELVISVLPDSKQTLLVTDSDQGAAGPEIQLLEGTEYRYELRGLADEGPYSTDSPELFRRSTTEGLSGRIRSGLFTGTVYARIEGANGEIGSVQLEVRATKLSYEDEYRWMLADIAKTLVEVVSSAFAPATWTFDFDAEADVRTTYQRFAFLNAVLDSDLMEGAIGQITSHPYRSWLPDREGSHPGRGVAGSSRLGRDLAAAGPRIATARPVFGLRTLPARIEVTSHHPTLDNPPNRFVKFALEHWLRAVDEMRNHLLRSKDKPAVRRGLVEASKIGDRLEAWLALPVFSDVQRLTELPSSNQVLQRRSGYRELYGTFLMSELAAKLSWPGGSDTVYPAGSRDVATLYEYWTYLVIAQLVSAECDQPLDLSSLVTPTKTGFELVLHRGQKSVVEGTTERLGLTLKLELFFNRTFTAKGGTASWTRAMRPDCSLRVTGFEDPAVGEIWIHFDAKYRVDGLLQLFGKSSESGTPEEDELEEAQDREGRGLRSKRADLLKMHAYRDAIRRSSGAYVLYPGEEVGETFEKYREILPGLGAFPLRPVGGGEASGADLLRKFLGDALDHLASTATQEARARFWTEQAYTLGPHGVAAVGGPALAKPPADTSVLLALVRDQARLAWILSRGLLDVPLSNDGGIPQEIGHLAFDLVIVHSDQGASPKLLRAGSVHRIVPASVLASEGHPAPSDGLSLLTELRLLEGGTITAQGILGVREAAGSDAAYVMTSLLAVIAASA
jgi:predicted component of viral defense system (DUF524 family)